MKLADKTIVITGGSQGIGLAAAQKCASEGARVILAARDKDALSRALAGLNALSAREHAVYQLDVGDFNAVAAFADWCSDNFAVGGLVNCAGIYGPIGRVDQVEMAAFARTIQVNFLGAVHMCNAFVSIMEAKTRKKIVNFAGGGAASPFPNYSAYAASKAALVRFTENLVFELADDRFDVNCIAPGFVITRMHEQTLAAGPELAGRGFYAKTQEQIESGGVPPEIPANLAVFLLSEASDGITGKFIAAPWDPWQDVDFQRVLRENEDLATLRRIDNKMYFKKAG